MWLVGLGVGLNFLRPSARGKMGVGFALVWLTFWVVAGCVGFGNVFRQHFRCVRWLRSGDCQLVEGPIENFRPMPYGGHAQESFTVAGVSFKYSDYDLSTCGFRNTSSPRGPRAQQG